MKRLHFLFIMFLAVLASACSGGSHDVSADLRKGSYRYRGGVLNGQPEGYGVLTCGDSVVYSGQWKGGRRCGYGTSTDSLGRTVTALWRADTIVRGAVADSSGVYRGELDSASIASGHGLWHGADDGWYEGAWRGGVPDGFGCGLTAGGKVQVGEWRAGRYLPWRAHDLHRRTHLRHRHLALPARSRAQALLYQLAQAAHNPPWRHQPQEGQRKG